MSLHQEGYRDIHTALFFWFLKYNIAMCVREQRPQEKPTATRVVLCNGTINAMREMFWSPPAELGTKPGSQPQSLWSWVKWGDHQTMQTVNSPRSAAARQEPSGVLCPLRVQISSWPATSRDRHRIACNRHAWSCANRHQLRIWLMYNLRRIYWQLSLCT